MIYVSDILDWCEHYRGPKYHAVITDPPYHLDGGFMGKEWDEGSVAFHPGTWSGIKDHMLPGAYGLAFCGSYNIDLLVGAIRSAGFIIHPTLFAWIYGTGMGRGTRIKNDSAFDGHRYGKLALKGSIEPIVCFQNPYDKKPQESIRITGAGSINIEAPKEIAQDDRYPSNVILSDDTAKHIDSEYGKNVSEYFFVCDWQDEVTKNLMEATLMFYTPKASRSERDIGLENRETVKVGVLEGRQDGSFEGPIPMGKNDHPTVKPIKLTTWMASLLLPPSQIEDSRILNPFGGSASEAIGAILAGWRFVDVVEKDEYYARIGVERIFGATGNLIGISVL